MRLVESNEEALPDDLRNRAARDYRTIRTYREIDQLIYRVLQLHDILDTRCEDDQDRALDVRRQIWLAQKQLDRLFNRLNG
jgi:hypothetical protein